MLDSFGSIKHFKLDTSEQNRNILEFSMTLQNDLRLIHLQRQRIGSSWIFLPNDFSLMHPQGQKFYRIVLAVVE